MSESKPQEDLSQLDNLQTEAHNNLDPQNFDSQQDLSYEEYDPEHDLNLESAQSLQTTQSLTSNEVYERLVKFTQEEIMELSSLTFDEALWMCLKYQWNKEKFVEQYYLPETIVQRDTQQIQYNLCKVCLTNTNLISLHCGHGFCESCYAMSIRSDLMNPNQYCLMDECQQRVPFKLIQQVLTEDEFKIYKNSLIFDFIQYSNNLTYCPGVDCQFILLYTQKEEILCVCGTKTCAECHEDHQPAPCHLVQKWQKMLKSDINSLLWIKINTNRCPNCQTMVEISEGSTDLFCQPPAGCGRLFECISGAPFIADDLIWHQQQDKDVFFYIDQFDTSMQAIQYGIILLPKVQQTQFDLKFLDQFQIQKYFDVYLKSTVYNRWNHVIGFYIQESNSDKEIGLFQSYQQSILSASKDVLEKFESLIENRMKWSKDELIVQLNTLKNRTMYLELLMENILASVTTGSLNI